MLNYQTAHIRKFDGGLTDRVVDNSANTFDRLYNFRIDKNANPTTREGFDILKDDLGTMSRLLYKSSDDRILGVSGISAIYEREDGYLGNADSFNDEITNDDNLAMFYDKGINYVTTLRNSYTNKRHHLRALYSEQKPISGNDSTYKIKSVQAGAPWYNVAVNISGGSTATNYIVVYKQRITANSGTGDQITLDSFGKSLVQSTSSGGTGAVISGFTSAIQPDYNEEVDIMVYRTRASDQAGDYYYVGSTSGTSPSSVADVSEAVLATRPRFYVSEGIGEMEQAPKHTASAIINGTAFYGNIEVATTQTAGGRTYTEYSYRIIQSFVGNPTMVNPLATYDFEDRIQGIAGLGNSLIVLTDSKIYRVDGIVNNDNTGGYSVRTISDDAGCISHGSCIVIDDILYFCGDNGVYYSDGYKVKKISVTDKFDVTETYKSYIKDYQTTDTRPIDIYRQRVKAHHDDNNDCIIWTMCSLGSTEANELLIFDLYNKCFYTYGGNGSYYCAVYIDKGFFIRGDSRSYIYKHSPEFKQDIVYDPNEPDPSNWYYKAIPFRLRSTPIDFGDPSVKKWVQAITTTISTRSKASIGLGSYNDNGSNTKELKSIVVSDVLLWRDRNLRWRDPEMKWRKPTTNSYRRKFPKRGLRCRYKQFEVIPTTSTIYASGLFGTATASYVVDGDPSSFYIDLDGANKTWPTDIVGYTIHFEEDGYNIGYYIRTISNDPISRIQIDGGGITVGSGKNFEIRGIRKKQTYTIENITLQYAILQNVGVEYKGGDGA